ncbi:hypothetical protein BH11MYX3_BH11MYX3_32730 [soil metagenome]
MLGVLMLAAPFAHAERTTTVNLGGMIGGVEHRVDEATRMEPAGGPRLILSFEHPPPALPPTKDTNVDVTLVPELIAGAVMNADRGEAMVGVGARGELRLSQRDAGLFHVNARMAFYAAFRALIVGEHQDPAGEVSLGEYVYLGRGRLRLGGEASLLLRKSDEFMATSGSQHGIMASVYLGWAM